METANYQPKRKTEEIILPVDNWILELIDADIQKIKQDIKDVDNKIRIRPYVFTFALKIKKRKLEDNLLVQEMLYDELKKQYKL